MAARMRLSHQADVRAKIQASQLVNRLQKHADGEIELSATQVQAAKILLDKSISNAPTEISGPDGDAIRVNAAEITDDELAGIASASDASKT